MEWISVKDRLPEKYGHYLIYDHQIGIPEIAVFLKNHNRFSTDKNGYKATHWMPLPEPPK